MLQWPVSKKKNVEYVCGKLEFFSLYSIYREKHSILWYSILFHSIWSFLTFFIFYF